MSEILKDGFTLMLYGILGVFGVLLLFYMAIKMFLIVENWFSSKKEANNEVDRVYSER